MKGFNSRTITRMLRDLGYDVELVKGDGYFYFTGPDDTLDGHAMMPVRCSVYVNNISSFTPDEWVKEFFEMKKGYDGTVLKGSRKPKEIGGKLR